MQRILSRPIGFAILSATLLGASTAPAGAQADAPPYGFRYGSPEQVGASAPGLAGLSVQLADWVREGAIVGGEILVIKGDRILLHDVVGWSDRDAGVPLRINSIYHMASMSKPFIGTATLMLVDGGLIELDQPVAELLPSFDRAATRSITIRQLLTHTAGWANEGPFPSDQVNSHPDLLTLVDSLAAMGPPYPPGRQYRYGDAHSWILGAIVESVSGLPSDRFIEERIVRPLGLTDTRMGFRREPGWMDRVNPRYRDGGDGWVIYWDPDEATSGAFFRPAGGAFMTALDYAAWLRHWMGLVAGDDSDAANLLTSSLAREAVSAGPLHPGYGLHWYVYGDAPLVFGHGGSDGTRAWAVPSEDLIVVYLTQSRGHRTLGEFGRLALDAAVPGLGMRQRLPEVSAKELNLNVQPMAREDAESLLGEYVIDEDRIVIAWDQGRLRMISDFWASYELALVDPNRFVMTTLGGEGEVLIAGPRVRIEFVPTISGEMAFRVIRAESGDLEFEAIRRR